LVGLSVDWSPRPGPHVASLVIFGLVGTFVTLVGEGMRTALERESKAQQEADLLLQELGHRIKNDLAMAASLIELQARSNQRPEVRTALQTASTRLRVLAAMHDHLRITPGDRVTAMQSYLSSICAYIGDTVRGLKPIAIQVDAGEINLP